MEEFVGVVESILCDAKQGQILKCEKGEVVVMIGVGEADAFEEIAFGGGEIAGGEMDATQILVHAGLAARVADFLGE